MKKLFTSCDVRRAGAAVAERLRTGSPAAPPQGEPGITRRPGRRDLQGTAADPAVAGHAQPGSNSLRRPRRSRSRWNLRRRADAGLQGRAGHYGRVHRLSVPLLPGSFTPQTFGDLKKNFIDTGKVRFFSRDLPLDSMHPNAMRAAEAGTLRRRAGVGPVLEVARRDGPITPTSWIWTACWLTPSFSSWT